MANPFDDPQPRKAKKNHNPFDDNDGNDNGNDRASSMKPTKPSTAMRSRSVQQIPSTNPFDKPAGSSKNTFGSGSGSGNGANPFDGNASAGHNQSDNSSQAPMLANVDAYSVSDANTNANTNVNTNTNVNKPPSITSRAKSTGSAGVASAGLLNRLNLKRGTIKEQNGSSSNLNSLGKGNKNNFAAWPFDDYHKAQDRFYQKIDSQNAEKLDHHRQEETDPYNMERPEELPDIHTAVQGLSLVDFEIKADTRAIGIVSTWLYDTGLIDELLDNGGGMATTTNRGATNNKSSSASVNTELSLKTSEGIEIGGTQGVPIEGSQKIDKEIDKFRSTRQRELAIINKRLNDGVAASGAEVQELVNAVTATKGDLGRLRELSTYISNGGDLEQRNKFMLQNYPRLKTVSNARRNLQRCLRDLEFFSEIPSTCQRLRDELHRCEWTETEWTTIRNVSMEHVELEILLVEAEAGMKARVEQDEESSPSPSMYRNSSSKGVKGSRMSNFGTNWNNSTGKSISKELTSEYVDRFLAPHVKNVWELGDEIRERLLGGIESSFELAMNDPAGMVALVESVEVYERAADEYVSRQKTLGTKKAEEEIGGLQFTDMRSAALFQICQNFEYRGLQVFKKFQEQAANVAQEDDEMNSQLNATLHAATELISEIGAIKGRVGPCFPPYWGIAAVWSTSCAKVCSSHILQQIGGEDAHTLPKFTVVQLLDLMACIEYFKEAIEETFPDISTQVSTNNYEKNRPDLLAANKKQVDVESARDVLAWTNNKLWKVHSLANDEFLNRTREQTEEWIDKVYSQVPEKHQTQDGKLTTSLPEDIFTLAGVQLRTIRERLSGASETVIQTSTVIFVQLRAKQMEQRDRYLEDLETCCAAANDFQRMSEKTEEIVDEIKEGSTFSDDSLEFLNATSEELIGLYNRDAVYAAGKVHLYVFEPITEAIGDGLFGSQWEKEFTHNDLALTVVKTLEDFMEDLEQFLDPMLLRKSVDSLIQASIAFYIGRLLVRADSHSGKGPVFEDNARALERMTGDIKVMKEYFKGLAESMPAVNRVIEREFETLTTIHELLAIAAGLSDSEGSDFVLVLQKRIRDVEITTHVVGDLWHLMNPGEERNMVETVEGMSEVLRGIVPQGEAPDHHTVPGLRLDLTIGALYTKSKRKRPGNTYLTQIADRFRQQDA